MPARAERPLANLAANAWPAGERLAERAQRPPAGGGPERRVPGRAAARARPPSQPLARGASRSTHPALITTADFPGCRAQPMGLADLAAHPDPIEYWDAHSQTAFAQAPPAPPSERIALAERFAALGGILAAASGAPIATITAPRLPWRDGAGALAAIAQADAAADLRPRRPAAGAWLARTGGPAVAEANRVEEVGAANVLPWPPDIVLDAQALAHPRKLALYGALGVGEVWVARRGSLAIRVLNATGEYAPAQASVAVPGWPAREIQAALHDAVLSWAATDSLRRAGRALVDSNAPPRRSGLPDRGAPER